MLLEDIAPQMFYHGTSTALGIEDALLPPEQSNRLSEVGRKKNLNKVFMTRDQKSAEIYAKKAVKQFGGEAVVYRVAPVGELTVLQDTPGTTVYMADGAKVLDRRMVDTPVRKDYSELVRRMRIRRGEDELAVA